MFSPLEPVLSPQGILRSVARYSIIQASIPMTLDGAASSRGTEALLRFISATPVETGEARANWVKYRIGVGQYVVANRATHRGVAYPGLLITGYGSRGQRTPGFHGTFNTALSGASANSALRSVWNDEATRPMAVPRLF